MTTPEPELVTRDETQPMPGWCCQDGDEAGFGDDAEAAAHGADESGP